MEKAKRMITLEEMRVIQLDILERIDTICLKHGLKYGLCGGTLLGAIRHKGYIPWDDDIDIIMPRRDYLRFLEIAPELFGADFTVSSLYNGKKHASSFSKIYNNKTVLKQPGAPTIGVFVDIFPVDGLPSDIKESDKHFKRTKLYHSLLLFSKSQNVMSSNFTWKTPLKWVLRFLCKLIGWRRFLLLMDKNASKFDFDESDFVAVSCVPFYGNKERVSKKAFSSFVKTPFEGRLFNIPVGYDEYLSNLYGDYMKLPPVEKRVSHHVFEAYWKQAEEGLGK